jgi:hypothetical protein
MSEVINKYLVQSYIMTAAKYDFSAYEKRIMYRIVELLQQYTAGIKLNEKYRIEESLFKDVDIQMPTSAFLKNEDDQNHSKARNALLSLNKKVIQLEDDKVWRAINLIERPMIDKERGLVTFRLHPFIAEAFMNFSKGFRKYELKIAMSFESSYAMRFYELLAGQTKPITFLIDNIKSMFQISDKYKKYNDFIKRVIIPAQSELDKYSPYSFTYKENTKPGSKKVISLTFIPKIIASNRDPELEAREMQKKIPVGYSLDGQTLKYLTDEYNFSNKEIQQWFDLFNYAFKTMDLLGFLAEKKRKAFEAKNPKGYIIACLKGETKWEQRAQEYKEAIEEDEDILQSRVKVAMAVAELNNKLNAKK